MPLRCACQRPLLGRDDDDPLHCYKCKDAVEYGYVTAHDMMTRVLFRLARSAGMMPRLETTHGQGLRPDLDMYDGKGNRIFFDFTGTTSNPKFYKSASSAKGVGVAAAASKREHEKMTKYRAFSEAAGADFFAFAIERNTVAFGPQAIAFLRRVEMPSFITGAVPTDMHELKTVIAFAACRANARLVRIILNSALEAERQEARKRERALLSRLLSST